MILPSSCASSYIANSPFRPLPLPGRAQRRQRRRLRFGETRSLQHEEAGFVLSLSSFFPVSMTPLANSAPPFTLLSEDNEIELHVYGRISNPPIDEPEVVAPAPGELEITPAEYTDDEREQALLELQDSPSIDISEGALAFQESLLAAGDGGLNWDQLLVRLLLHLPFFFSFRTDSLPPSSAYVIRTLRPSTLLSTRTESSSSLEPSPAQSLLSPSGRDTIRLDSSLRSSFEPGQSSFLLPSQTTSKGHHLSPLPEKTRWTNQLPEQRTKTRAKGKWTSEAIDPIRLLLEGLSRS